MCSSDLVQLLEASPGAIGASMILDRASAALDRLSQDRGDGAGKITNMSLLKAMRARARMQAGTEQCLVDIDVAEAGDQRLVEQGRLQRRFLAGEEARDQRAVEFVAQRLDADVAKAFKDSESVNRALRLLLDLAKGQVPPVRPVR